MNWFDKLKALINFEVNSPILSVNIARNSNNINKEDYYYDSGEKRLDIYSDNLPNEKGALLKSIFKEYLAEGNKVFERNTLKLLHRLNNFREKKEYDYILNFFKDLISPTDYEALEASLFLRHIFTQHGDVGKLKRDIRERFGERGKNIANLCTAGYFEEFLMPLFNSSKDRFNELYDIIVSKSPLAIFVHSETTDSQIINEIRNKLEILRKYGIKFMHIHGISKNNVLKVKEFIKSQKDYLGFFEKEIYEKDNIIIVELILK